jgi:HEAT repeat protein
MSDSKISTDNKPMMKGSSFFENLVRVAPQELIELLPSLEAAELTFALEIFGRELSSDRAVPELLKFLRHPRPLVREGAILGLTHHLEVPGVLEALAGVAENDPVAEIRESAGFALYFKDTREQK